MISIFVCPFYCTAIVSASHGACVSLDNNTSQ